jgi:adenylate cyclase
VASTRQSQSSQPASKPQGSTAKPSGSSTDRRTWLTFALIIAASLGLAWALSLAAAGIRGDWNNRLNDLFFQLRYRLRGPEKVLPSIGHVDLSDSELRSLGMKGGDRRDFARLVKVLSNAGASSVIFDIIFPEQGEPEGDAAFVQAVAKAQNVYLPALLPPQAYDKLAGPAAQGADLLAPWLWHPKVLRKGNPLTARTSTLSFPELTAAARGIAHFNSEPDPDGVYRRMPLLIGYADGFMPSLALRAAADALQVDPSAIEVSFGKSLRLPRAKMPDSSVRDVSIPIDQRGRMIVDFAGPWGKEVTPYSFAGLLNAETDPDVADQAAAVIDGTHVIVADITTSAADYGPVPFEQVYPKVGLHLNILNSILSDRFLRAPSWWLVLLMNLAFAALVWLIAWRMRPLACSLLTLLCWAALSAGEFWLFAARGVMPMLAAPTLGVVLQLIAVNGYRFFLSEREKLALRMRMERYFAPRLMSKILANQGKLMSADQKVITVLFSDISGFTSWSTTQTPDSIHRTLNEYFEVMTEIVFRHEGTVDKFIGDGLMAFFGDPLPQPDHALRAVRTAVEMQQALRGLRERWQVEGRTPLHIRIGINSGEVVVGDMGSRRIMAYTAIGANVNLGSRLESKAPIDGVLVSAPVYAAVKDSVGTRFAGKITAKGITEDFETWEVIVP